MATDKAIDIVDRKPTLSACQLLSDPVPDADSPTGISDDNDLLSGHSDTNSLTGVSRERGPVNTPMSASPAPEPGATESKMDKSGRTAKSFAGKNLKAFSLVALTLQNALLIMVMRHVRIRQGDLFMSTTAVIMSELCKFLFSLSVIFWLEGCSAQRFVQRLHLDIVQQPIDCLKISVPAIVYTLQNNLLYVAVSNLEAATYQVTYQLKILTTALFSVFMLRKELSRSQWMALLLLFVGVSCVQLQPSSSKPSATVNQEQRPFVGLVAVVVSCMMSGFAGVYFEKILKGTSQTLWLRNVQLAFLGVVIGLITMEINDGVQIHEKGFFFGYDWVVWFVVFLQSFGGIMVAVVVKYADNILKGFATSASIVISCIASMYFFDFQLSVQFTVGASLVISAVYIYSKYPPQAPPAPLAQSA